jgi:hypothetical protein
MLLLFTGNLSFSCSPWSYCGFSNDRLEESELDSAGPNGLVYTCSNPSDYHGLEGSHGARCFGARGLHGFKCCLNGF